MRYKDLVIQDFTIEGKCSCCGQCCGDILHLSRHEIKRIDIYLKTHKIEPTPKCILVDIDNTCPFRDNVNKKCKIYEVRPDICRVYQCNKTPEEAYRNRELNNKNRLPRSMRNLFFKEESDIKKFYNIPIYERKDKLLKNE